MADYLDFEKVDYLDDEILVYEKKVYDIGRCIKFPFEDVAPVVHAHWIFYTNGTCDCSNCHTVWESNMLNRWIEYCPFCGARMDEEVNDA